YRNPHLTYLNASNDSTVSRFLLRALSWSNFHDLSACEVGNRGRRIIMVDPHDAVDESTQLLARFDITSHQRCGQQRTASQGTRYDVGIVELGNPRQASKAEAVARGHEPRHQVERRDALGNDQPGPDRLQER